MSVRTIGQEYKLDMERVKTCPFCQNDMGLHIIRVRKDSEEIVKEFMKDEEDKELSKTYICSGCGYQARFYREDLVKEWMQDD